MVLYAAAAVAEPAPFAVAVLVAAAASEGPMDPALLRSWRTPAFRSTGTTAVLNAGLEGTQGTNVLENCKVHWISAK